MNKQTIRDIEVKGKRVLVRVDFNVPLDKQTSAITDDTRIRAALPTIKYLLDRGAKVILCSHLGRPDGKVVERLRLAVVGKRLSELLGLEVISVADSIGPEVEQVAGGLAEGGVMLLENLRFHPEEEKNAPAFASALAQLADVFVNDAFGTAHRAHASTVGVATCLPAVAGFLMEKEIEAMGNALSSPTRPFAAIIGGAKISDKIAVLGNLLEKVDSLLIGGGMACTFLKAEQYEVGQSLVEDEKLGIAKQLMEKAAEKGVNLLLPSDVVVAQRFDTQADFRTVPVSGVPAGWFIMDIGEETIERFESELKRCRTIIWNGPMGVFEFPRFAEGTRAIIAVLADLEATTIIGGGETAAAVEEMGFAQRITHISTGGGATLEFLEGKTLPGVAALRGKS